MPNNPRLQAAFQLAHKGRYLFPADKHKKPVITDWPNNATKDTSILKAWFERQNYNIAVITGEKSGFFCLDVDGEAGKDSLLQLEKQYSPISADTVCIASTPSNGVHYYFKIPENLDLRNSAGKLGKGLDIRANGGYVVVPPSRVINKDGIEAHYEWLNPEITLAKGQLPDAPPWLLELLTTTPKSTVPKAQPKPIAADGYTTAYGRKALEAECAKVFQAIEGMRNDTLNHSAFNVFRLVAGGEIAADDAENELKVAAGCCGLEVKEIALTLASAKSKAYANPKSAPARAISSAPSPQLKSISIPEPPLEVFPAKIRQMLEQAAMAFKFLPIEVPMVAFIAFLAACVERSRVVVVKDGWEEAGNLYIGLVAGSGMGKSPCFKAFFKHIWKHEVQNKTRWDIEMEDYNLVLEERRKIKNPDELGPLPPKPIRTQYLVEDITLEAIINILAENPRGLMWYSDELSSIVLNFDRYSNAKGGTKSKLLSLYDSAPCKTNRQDREKDQVVPAATLSIVGTVQPSILKELFSKMDAASGFLPRIILILAKRTQPAYLKDIVFTGDELLQKIANRLLADNGGEFIPRRIPLSRTAYNNYESWHNEQLMDSTFPESDAIQAIAAKVGTQVIRLALLLHCLNAVLNDTSELTEISAATMDKAIKLGDWIIEHQKRIWLALGIDDGPVMTPLEQAIVAVSLELEAYLSGNDWRVSNQSFNMLVCSKMNAKLDCAQIGRTASSLGIKSVHVNRSRAKEFSPELLQQFKLNYYL